ncbi:hypothetical protein D6764_01490 [Candidatus Woesearchaeota archaeon]|nr:MAG: hypothetical protein D6764_01490 [Candidatus Woesearchaeota archaeon]
MLNLYRLKEQKIPVTYRIANSHEQVKLPYSVVGNFLVSNSGTAIHYDSSRKALELTDKTATIEVPVETLDFDLLDASMKYWARLAGISPDRTALEKSVNLLEALADHPSFSEHLPAYSIYLGGSLLDYLAEQSQASQAEDLIKEIDALRESIEEKLKGQE